MAPLLRELYFGFIVILMVSELVARNLYSLIFQIERPAETMAVSVEVIRAHLSMLLLLDAIPAIGAMLVLWAFRHTEAVRSGRIGVFVTTLGLLAFGVYQFWYATYRLENFQSFTQAASIIYLILGIIAWYVGGSLRRGVSSS